VRLRVVRRTGRRLRHLDESVTYWLTRVSPCPIGLNG
jgi:hypothetical protein